MRKKRNYKRYMATSILLFMILPFFLTLTIKAESLTEAGESITYSYTATVEEYVAVLPGFYTLEVWGAAGGSYAYPEYRGFGGYASGTVYLNAGDKLYICVGSIPPSKQGGWELGGYNGGGKGNCSGGGGATHIALNSNRGVLKNYESYKEEILIVAGGAGGDTGYGSGGINGGAGGGYSGTSYGNSVNVHNNKGGSGSGGTQTAGGAGGYFDDGDDDYFYGEVGSFGQGGEGKDMTAGGGGGGWYGGGGGASRNGSWGAGGGGSGYVGGVYDGYMETGVRDDNGSAKITLSAIDTSAVSSGGGSSYVSTDFGNRDSSLEAGINTGDGQTTLSSGDIGYLADTSLSDVKATDKAAPDAVSTEEGKVTFTVVDSDETCIEVVWTEPLDNGTDYYHKVESHFAETLERISISNVTKNTLTSGVTGYYYVLDETPDTAVTLLNGTYTVENSLEVALTTYTRYLHLAAVDKAGNLSSTGTIKLKKETMAANWAIYTEQVKVAEDTGDSAVTGICKASADNTWYVRSDGETPISLSFRSYIKGDARADYQINRSIFEEKVMGETVERRNIIETPMHAISTEDITTIGSSLGDFSDDDMLLQGDAGLKTVRSSRNKILDVTRPFTVLSGADGKTIRVTPIAGIVTEDKALYSNYEEDKAHSIYLIGDSTVPQIGGMEVFETDLFAGGSPVTVTLTASDTGSGVGSFYAVLTNTDNLVTKTFTSTDNSTLSMELAEDSLLLEGNVTVEVYAADKVGNQNRQNGSITGFTLEADVERMLAPHDPIFQCGESGILTIVTKGYAERVTVEFPEAMSALDAELDTTFDYTGDRQYRQEEKLEFMIPLYTPENENYVITVRAYKGERELVANPDLCTIEVNGTILDDFRTRLR